MKHNLEPTEPRQQYAEAYAAHYTEHNLPLALRLYQQVLSSQSDAPEAEYARVQIQNIVNAVIPKWKLLDAQVALALAHFEKSGLRDTAQNAATPLASANPG